MRYFYEKVASETQYRNLLEVIATEGGDISSIGYDSKNKAWTIGYRADKRIGLNTQYNSLNTNGAKKAMSANQ